MGVRREVIGVAIARTDTWIRQSLQKTFRHTHTPKINCKVAKFFLRTVRKNWHNLVLGFLVKDWDILGRVVECWDKFGILKINENVVNSR